MRKFLSALGRRLGSRSGSGGATPPKGPSDPRWLSLAGREWTCGHCKQIHTGLFEFGAHAPGFWEGEADYAANGELGRFTPFLSEDFCVIEESHFVRAVLPLPLVGWEGQTFAYGVWVSLAEPNFKRYVEQFDATVVDESQAWFGWLSTRLAGYPDTLLLKTDVHPRNDRQRPVVMIQPSEHTLYVEQRDGVTFDRLMEIYALHGHGPTRH
ncbi:MAG: DUF2199 domain-containing protein [Proteobacteria bacterium]|nr:DUF2199 domain-containing protein [Pseudomonadota bacterium]